MKFIPCYALQDRTSRTAKEDTKASSSEAERPSEMALLPNCCQVTTSWAMESLMVISAFPSQLCLAAFHMPQLFFAGLLHFGFFLTEVAGDRPFALRRLFRGYRPLPTTSARKETAYRPQQAHESSSVSRRRYRARRTTAGRSGSALAIRKTGRV